MTEAGAVPVITLDGPGGSGKGTIARALAQTLGWHLLDSGVLYRVTGIACRERGLDMEDTEALAAVARGLDVHFQPGDDRITLEGRDVTAAIRIEEAGTLASVVAALPAVRRALLVRQRDFRRPPGLVADGRDMGTVVFPDARLKVFLTASAAERAQRRRLQLLAVGESVSLARLLRDIEERDARDRSRAVAPLVPAGDAIAIDSTAMPVPEVLARVLDLARQRGLAD